MNRPLSTGALKAIAAAIGAVVLGLFALNGMFQFMGGSAVSVKGDGNVVQIVAPENPLELQPADICKLAKAEEVRKEETTQLGGTSYSAVLTDQTGRVAWFLLWTDTPDETVRARAVIEVSRPDPAKPGQTLTEKAWPPIDQATVDCLKARAI